MSWFLSPFMSFDKANKMGAHVESIFSSMSLCTNLSGRSNMLKLFSSFGKTLMIEKSMIGICCL
ncbi:hypothetical protein Peur_036900 [Populus x canadensis]